MPDATVGDVRVAQRRMASHRCRLSLSNARRRRLLDTRCRIRRRALTWLRRATPRLGCLAVSSFHSSVWILSSTDARGSSAGPAAARASRSRVAPDPPRAWSTAFLRDQRRRAAGLVRAVHALDLAHGHAEVFSDTRLRRPALANAQHPLGAIDLFLAHGRQDRRRHAGPRRRNPTFPLCRNPDISILRLHALSTQSRNVGFFAK